MDKRILESVREFYKNVKGQHFDTDIDTFAYRNHDFHDDSFNPNNTSREFYL